VTGHELKSIAISARLIGALKPFFFLGFSSHVAFVILFGVEIGLFVAEIA
jgi:hypothetical protein